MTTQGRAEKFLDAFNRIEAVLRQRAKLAQRDAGFRILVDNSNELTVSQKKKLLDMADLRNVIVHMPRDDRFEIYADPRQSTVDWIENQADIIENPPKVISALRLSPPEVLDGQAEIDVFLAETLAPKNFSQALFRNDRGELSLVTTNSLARWVATSYKASDGLILESATVEEVALFREVQDNPLLKARGMKVVEAIRIFSGETGNVAPAAIVITETGRATEGPLGICTPADVPALYRALGI